MLPHFNELILAYVSTTKTGNTKKINNYNKTDRKVNRLSPMQFFCKTNVPSMSSFSFMKLQMKCKKSFHMATV